MLQQRIAIERERTIDYDKWLIYWLKSVVYPQLVVMYVLYENHEIKWNA